MTVQPHDAFTSVQVQVALIDAHRAAANDERKETFELERVRDLLARVEAALAEAVSRRSAFADALCAIGPMPTRHVFGGGEEVYSLERAQFIGVPTCMAVADRPGRAQHSPR